MLNSTSQIDRDTVLPLASSLIAIPSVSGNEFTIMQWVQNWARRLGLDVTVVSLDPQRPNLIISIGDPTGGPTLAMNGHLDVVPVSDGDAWRTDPFMPVVSQDGVRLYGRGSSDMKASVGVMLSMMGHFRNSSLAGCLQAHIVTDEELSGNFGTLAVINAITQGVIARPTWCLIGEKSDLKVRNAERGILKVVVTVHGRASHTAAARVSGINAIALAAKAVLALEHDIDRFHPSVGKPVISINGISGGVAHNIVPGECTFAIDRRLIPGETMESVVAEITGALDAITVDDSRFRYTMVVDPDGDFIAANLTDVESPVVRAVWDSSREIRGVEPEYFVQWAGVTDGRYYRQIGIDTVGYGPGGENAHGANEAVFVDDLVTQARVYARTIERLLQPG